MGTNDLDVNICDRFNGHASHGLAPPVWLCGLLCARTTEPRTRISMLAKLIPGPCVPHGQVLLGDPVCDLSRRRETDIGEDVLNVTLLSEPCEIAGVAAISRLPRLCGTRIAVSCSGCVSNVTLPCSRCESVASLCNVGARKPDPSRAASEIDMNSRCPAFAAGVFTPGGSIAGRRQPWGCHVTCSGRPRANTNGRY
jgi:hypothetical protein